MSDILIADLAVKQIEVYGKNFLDLLEALPEEQLWITPGGIPNSIGVLARHLTGNLNHYFGTAFVKTGYHRERNREFTPTGLPKATVIADLQAALKVARQAVATLEPGKIGQPYTSPDGTVYESLGAHLVHMAAHFAMHYGQADYAQNFMKPATQDAT